jgi:hypothetical protein
VNATNTWDKDEERENHIRTMSLAVSVDPAGSEAIFSLNEMARGS